jgi:hypothetical protein
MVQTSPVLEVFSVKYYIKPDATASILTQQCRSLSNILPFQDIEKQIYCESMFRVLSGRIYCLQWHLHLTRETKIYI